MPVSGDPPHVPAPVVADQVEPPPGPGGRVGQVEDVLDQPVDRVGVEALGRIRPHPGGVAPLVGRDRAIAGRPQGGDLVAPRVPRLWIAVEQEDQRAARGACGVGGEGAFGRCERRYHRDFLLISARLAFGFSSLSRSPRSFISARLAWRLTSPCMATAYAISSVHTVNLVSVVLPKDVVSATSTASRPRPMRTRPMRGLLCRASSVCQPSPR